MYREEEYYQHIIRNLKERGVELKDIVELVHYLQDKHINYLSDKFCEIAIKKVLHKREIQNAIMTGIDLDRLAEEEKLSTPMQRIMETDEGTYGVDEQLAIGAVSALYGSIAVTNYGYIDIQKPGILEWLNDKSTGKINVFLDDIVGAIAACASGALAHADRSARNSLPEHYNSFEINEAMLKELEKPLKSNGLE